MAFSLGSIWEHCMGTVCERVLFINYNKLSWHMVTVTGLEKYVGCANI